MKYFYQSLICLAIAIGYLPSYAQQTPSDNNIYRVVLSSNGQSYILCNTLAGSVVYTDIYFRIGPVYEFDSVSGISFLLTSIISDHIGTNLKSSGRQIKYYSTVEPEQIGFHFESDAADLGYIFKLSDDNIAHVDISDDGLEEAQTAMKTDLDSLSQVESFINKRKILRALWTKAYKKLNMYGDQETYLKIKAENIKAFHHKYFLPVNNMISVVGTYPKKDILDKLQSTFKDFKSAEFNPELITNVIDFKPMINTIQMIAPAQDKNLATVTYQNPGARQDRANTYCAYILSELINDKNGRIQKNISAAGLKGLKAVYDCNNFYGTFEISAQPAGNNFNGAFVTLNNLIDSITKKDYFNEQEIAKAISNIDTEYATLKNGYIKQYMNFVTRYRFSNDESYFTGMPDSLAEVDIPRMRLYVGSYFANYAASVRCLYVSASAQRNAIDSEKYYALDPTVSDVTFTYDQNITDITRADDKHNLDMLIQWLQINPDEDVQINGFSDRGEYSKSYDDTIKKFIENTPSFHKAMPDAFKKGYLRIEFMRAIKIAKLIYEAGIPADRITGTSMTFSSDTPEGAAANRKCTVTLDKIKPHISLYEYHFGRKKEEDDQILPPTNNNLR